MYKGHKVLATVCARGGSKGVKNKNIRPLGGKPMICRSLDILKKCKWIDNYVISTDSPKIMKIARNYGFDIYFKRPAYLAGGKVSRLDVIKHGVRWMEQNKGVKADIVIDLGVATPLKNAQDVENSVKLLLSGKTSNVFSVTPAERNPYYNMVEIRNGRIKVVKALGKKLTDRRDAPVVYNMNDGILVWWKKKLFSQGSMLDKNAKMYVMPRERSVDIDEEADFAYAEYLVRQFRIGNLEIRKNIK